MSKWKEVTIGELGKVVTGNTPPKKDPENYGGKYPFIKPTDMVIDQRFVYEYDETYSEKAYQQYHRSYIPPFSTGVVTIGTVGEKLFLSHEWCFTNQSVNVVIPDEDKYDNFFIYYLMKYSLPKVSKANPGTASGRHHVSKSNFCSIKVNVPPLQTQQKIASILSTYDNLIENNNRRIAILEEMAQKLYREWFVKFRFPGYEEVKMVESELGLIPEGWEVVDFGSLVDYLRESIPKGTLDDPIPYMGLEHMPRHSIALSNWDMQKEIGSTKLKFQKGDILFGKIRPYFHKVGVAQTSGVCSSDTFVLRPKEQYYSLAVCVASSDDFVAYSVQTSQGTKMPRANWDVLKEYKVALPTNDLLKKFDEILKPMISSIDNLSAKDRNLKKQRDLLLPRLISGKIDV